MHVFRGNRNGFRQTAYRITTAYDHLATNGATVHSTDTNLHIFSSALTDEKLLPALHVPYDSIVEAVRAEELAIFVDEADYVVGNARIMETLRDIYDATEQPLILVGMEEIARRISQRKQLFNRISQWIEFKPADLEDVSLIASEMLEVDVEIDDALLDLIRKRSNGVVRTIVSALDKIEKMAMASDARIIRLEDVDASELLHDVRRSR